jgi:hypothetical protein
VRSDGLRLALLTHSRSRVFPSSVRYNGGAKKARHIPRHSWFYWNEFCEPERLALRKNRAGTWAAEDDLQAERSNVKNTLKRGAGRLF